MSRLEWERITLKRAKENWAAGLPITLIPCKCHPGSQWGIAYTIYPEPWVERAKAYREHPTLWKGTVEKTSWALMYTNWAHYNAGPELGSYAHYYMQEAVNETCEAQ